MDVMLDDQVVQHRVDVTFRDFSTDDLVDGLGIADLVLWVKCEHDVSMEQAVLLKFYYMKVI